MTLVQIIAHVERRILWAGHKKIKRSHVGVGLDDLRGVGPASVSSAVV